MTRDELAQWLVTVLRDEFPGLVGHCRCGLPLADHRPADRPWRLRTAAECAADASRLAAL